MRRDGIVGESSSARLSLASVSLMIGHKKVRPGDSLQIACCRLQSGGVIISAVSELTERQRLGIIVSILAENV